MGKLLLSLVKSHFHLLEFAIAMFVELAIGWAVLYTILSKLQGSC